MINAIVNQPVTNSNWKYYLKSLILGFSLSLFLVDLLALIFIFINPKFIALDHFIVTGFVAAVFYLLLLNKGL